MGYVQKLSENKKLLKNVRKVVYYFIKNQNQNTKQIQTLANKNAIYFQSLADEEDGRCVVYLTSLGVIRDTIQRCSNVSKILRNLFVR